MKKIALFIFVTLVSYFSFCVKPKATDTFLCAYKSIYGKEAQLYVRNGGSYHFLYWLDASDIINYGGGSFMSTFSNPLTSLTISAHVERYQSIVQNGAYLFSSGDAKTNDFTLTGAGLSKVKGTLNRTATSADEGDAEWSSDQALYNFRNFGYCPDYVVVDGPGLTDFSGKVNIIFKNSSDTGFVSKIFDSDVFSKLVQNGNNKFDLVQGSQRFTPTTYSKVNQLATTCPSDAASLNDGKTSLKYLLLSLQYFSRTHLIKFYENAGVRDNLPVIIEKYSEGGDCYNAATDKSVALEIASDANMMKSICDTGAYYNFNVKTCSDIIGDPNDSSDTAYYLNNIFRMMQYLGPILLIVLSIFEYGKAAISSDKDIMVKTNKRTIVRIIFTLLLFFIPLFIRILLDIFSISSDCGLG